MRTAGMLKISIAAAVGAAVAAVMLVIALGGTAPAGANAARAGCPNADAPPRGTKSEKLAAAVECLIGKARNRDGVGALDRVGSLEKVANKHTDVMIAEDCLDHQCGNETTLKKRIVRSGYPRPGGRYGFAEVTGCALTPRAMVDAWLDEEVHSRRVLGEKYRDIGVGADKGKPNVGSCDDGLHGVYTVIVAWRRG